MIHHFDHRLGTYEGQTQAQANMGTLPRLTPEQKRNPSCSVLPRYWVAEKEVDARLKERWGRAWLFGWRDIARSTDERTVICSFLPKVAVGHKFPLMLPFGGIAQLAANLSSFVLDYAARQKSAGASVAYFVLKQLPVLSSKVYKERAPWNVQVTLEDWIKERVLELTFTSYDMESLAQELGDQGPPFVWDEKRRLVMRAELDAAYFRLYGVERDDVGYIMDSFGAFRRNDPERFERTKALILEIYDAMGKAEETGEPYQSLLDPPPGHGPRHSEK